jgi:hypothetical protein
MEIAITMLIIMAVSDQASNVWNAIRNWRNK